MSHVCAPTETAIDPRQLAVDNLRLAYKVASSFTRRAQAVGLDMDDLRQEAVVALMRAAAVFDPARGFAFSTLAYKVIRQHLLGVLKKRRNRPLAGLPRDCNGQELAFKDEHGEAPDAPAEGDDEKALVQRLMLMLHPEDRRAIELHYLGSKTLSEVAQATGVSKERVRQRLVRALARMRTVAGQEEAPALASSAG